MSHSVRLVYPILKTTDAGLQQPVSRTEHVASQASGVFIPSILQEPDYLPVDVDEMSFALGLFVNAANRKMACRAVTHIDFSQEHRDECDALFLGLCGEQSSFPALGPKRRGEETSLHEAFRVLCENYDKQRDKTSICARVLAFYFLMERSAGAVLSGWVKPCPETPNEVILNPAIIHAISCVRLNGSVLLHESRFLELVERMAFEAEHRESLPVQ